MLYAGVAWTATGYQVEVVDDSGMRARPPADFGAGEIGGVITYLRAVDRAGEKVITVIDSTNGVLAGGMMAAGLEVYRADPWVLPERPRFGSVSAADLAHSAQSGLLSLARLKVGSGVLTGRIDELNAGITASSAAVDTLTSLKRCLSHGDRGGAEIALTFDDGPNPPYTGRILDILDRYGVPATFFCVGLHASAHQEEMARIAAAGHRIGNHTWSHPFLPDLSWAQLIEQVRRTSDTIAEWGGAEDPMLFRPPYGSCTPDIVAWLAGLYVTVVLSDVDPFDWALPGPTEIARIVLARAKPGSILLLHDGGGDRSQTVAALPGVIEGLLDRGLRFVPVDEMVRSTELSSRQ